jgi:signal transduction histidine kinase/CheY-like chemotaxis protein/HAMP domain-containing protein
MTSFSSLRARLVGTVFLAIAPAWVITYLIVERTGNSDDLPWTFLAGGIGLLALAAAWFGGERFVLRQVRLLLRAAQRLAQGDLSSRTGLATEKGELGELARTFDSMAHSLEDRVKEREAAERTLLYRSFQQTVIGALGQFAMISKDVPALLNQAVMLAAQTLEVEYAGVLEINTSSEDLVLIAGVGWKDGSLWNTRVPLLPNNETGFTLANGEPLIIEDLATEKRFKGSTFLKSHGVVSGISVAISGHGRSFGMIFAHTTNRRQFTEDEVHFLYSMATVVAMAIERMRAEMELTKLAAFAKLNPNPAMELDASGRITYFNDAALRLAASVGLADPKMLLPNNIAELTRHCLDMRPGMLRVDTVFENHMLSWSFHPVLDSQVVHCYVEDITNRLNLEAQLRQAQKMESLGQLAAGVAHDFNNMLTIIQGHAGMLRANPTLPDQLRQSAQAIFFGSERAASLTRQLLMFSRKNVIQPELLDLREVVSNLAKMLQRLLGETVSLTLQMAPEAPLIHADIGMVEQVIMNLAVNARDAMAKGGSLTIETLPIEIDAAYVEAYPQGRLGTFVLLRVTDTGCGMDEVTLARIFEPFFTTKEIGKGTGLGLATVYGIVKQHEGWITVASRVNVGTTFSILFPASTRLADTKVGDALTAPPEVPQGTETILVVEDEPVLRDLAHVILENCGYKIIEAGSGVEALEIWNQNQDKIDLVLTDVVMPEGISGMDLAQRLHATRPDLRIVFASGYSMDEMDAGFMSTGTAAFIQKPYTHVTLAQTVRACLDR